MTPQEEATLSEAPNSATELRIGPASLYLGDALAGLEATDDDCFDLAIADPPYGAVSPNSWFLKADHQLKGFGGPWKLAASEWDKAPGTETFGFLTAWLSELKRVVRPTGSIWIHATYHNSGFVNVACQLLGLEIINEVIWFKRNAFPNLAGRRLTASHESLLWVHTGGAKRRYRFNYEDVKASAFEGDSLKVAGKQLRTVWDIPNNKPSDERRFGSHPTQKPVRLAERLLLISGTPGGSLLVPFMGSGSEMVAGLRRGMRPVGYETDPEYFSIAQSRVRQEVDALRLPMEFPE